MYRFVFLGLSTGLMSLAYFVSAHLLAVPMTASANISSIDNIPATPIVVAQSAGNYQAEGTYDDTSFTVRVVELSRASGDSVLLRLAITNTGGDNLTFRLLNATRNESIYVVDAEQQVRAYPLRDSRGIALGTNISTTPNIRPSETREVFAQFPAPPASTTRLSVYFPHAYSPIENVPITP
jgi:hypothetical protein